MTEANNESTTSIPLLCGDGETQLPEECDQGPKNADAGQCTTKCKMAKCGDGLTYTLVEECDDGNDSNEDDCLNSCRAATCGDGLVRVGLEICDDGNSLDSDGCTNACQLAICGDGIVALQATVLEACDDGNLSDDDACLSDCTQSSCGDGYVYADGGEECDDANDAMDDTCSLCKRIGFWVFLSSHKYNGGGFSNLATADSVCTLLSKETAISGNYKAWLSDNETSAATRIFHSTAPYILPTKQRVADNWDDLTDGSLDRRINIDEVGELIYAVPAPETCDSLTAKDVAVWTGTSFGGEKIGVTCQNWTSWSSDYLGYGGLASTNNPPWTSGCHFKCDTKARFYCIEQP